MPSLRELAVLRAARLAAEGATFRVAEEDRARCISRGWLTSEGELTDGHKLLLEETSGDD